MLGDQLTLLHGMDEPARVAIRVPTISPMLASSSGRPPDNGAWAVEPKLDRWRCLVRIGPGVRAWTRTGRDITDAVPQLQAMQYALVGRTLLLDGELICGAGRPEDFYRLGASLARRHRHRAGSVSFVAFDLLEHDGIETMSLPYAVRRRLLESVALSAAAWNTVPSFVSSPVEVLVEAERLGLEGVIAKQVESTYRPGVRSRQWVKLKSEAWRSVHGPRRRKRLS